MQTQGYVILTFEFRKSGRRWTAYCRELGTATFGRSLTDAENKLDEAVLLHLNTLEDVGERERFFKEHDLKFYEHKPAKNTTISVPLNENILIRTRIQPVRELVLA